MTRTDETLTCPYCREMKMPVAPAKPADKPTRKTTVKVTR